jgi:hypothetical protein
MARAGVRASLVPHTSVGRRLAVAALIDSLGSSMFLSGSAIYFTRIVGLSPAAVGLGLSVAGLVGLLGSVPIGMAGDRFGPGRVYVAIQVWRALAYAAYALAGGFPAFVVIASAIELGDASTPAIAQAVVGLAVPDEERVETLAKVRAVRNIGFGLGAGVAAAALAWGTRPAFLALIVANAGLVLLSAWLLARVRTARWRTPGIAGRRFEPASDAAYLGAALLNGVLSIHLTLLFVGLPLWVATRTRAPVAIIGVLIAVNTAMAVALQARLSTRARDVRGAVDCMVRAGLALAGFGVVAFLMGRVGSVPVAALLSVLAVVLLTCGELWQSAGAWAISYGLAPTGRQAQYLATFQLGTALQAVLAPALVVALVFPLPAGWLGFAVVVAAAGLLTGPVVRLSRSEVRL